MPIQHPTNLMRAIGISVDEVERRRHVFDFSAKDQERLQKFAPLLEPELPRIVSDFYKRQLENEEIAALIDEPDTLKRLHQTMRSFLSSLFKAKYDEDYINSRLRIGKVHKTLNVTPKLYMSALSTLQYLLDENIDALCDTDPERRQLEASLHKALLFDCQLVFDAYIHSYQVDMEEAYSEINDYASHLEIKVEALTRELHEQSLRDALTGIFNRRTFMEYMERELKVAERYRLPISLAYFDLNGFKAVNDTYGHDAGDDVLRDVGKVLMSITRSVDVPARFGGDEFCMLMPRCDVVGARIPLQRLIDQFDKVCKHDVTFSVGLVQTGPETFEDAESLMKRADTLMYEAKTEAHKVPGHYVRPLS